MATPQNPEARPPFWHVTPKAKFPEESDKGDFGFDPETGNIWRDDSE